METLSLISTVTGLGTLSGLNLSLTVLLTGLAVRFNFLSLGLLGCFMETTSLAPYKAKVPHASCLGGSP